MMKLKRLLKLVLALAVMATLELWIGYGVALAAHALARPSYEVWVLDQSDTHADGGGLLHIYKDTWWGSIRSRPETIDLAEAAMEAGFPVTRRPHIVGFNVESTHAIISNVASGDIQIMNVAERSVVGNIEGLGQLHMAGPAPNSEQIAAVAIAQGRLLIISTDYENDFYTVEHTVDLELAENANGSLEEQLGFADPHPICSNYTLDSQYLFVNFTAGGLAIFNVGNIAVPPVLEEVYSATEVPGNGCGLIQHPDGKRMFTNSGSKKLGDAENVYVWDMRRVGNGLKDDLLATIPLLTPAQSAAQRGDAHGPMFTAKGRYLWVAMRMDNTIKVVDTKRYLVVNTIHLAGRSSRNPTPDVIDTNPRNNLMFMSLRGHCPLSAISEFVDETSQDCPGDQSSQISSPGRTPGLGIVKINRRGTGGRLIRVLPLTNIVDGFDRVDPHGIKTVIIPKRRF